MIERECEKCQKKFDYSEKIYICNQCTGRLCFSCSGGGGSAVCQICAHATQFIEITFQP